MAKEFCIGEGYYNVTPSLAFKEADAANTWYKKIFGAEEKMRMDGTDKRLMHAGLNIGDAMILLPEENPG